VNARRRGGAPGGDGVVARAGVEGAVGGDAAGLLLGRDRVEKFGQHGRVAHVAGGEPGGPDCRGFPVDPDMDRAPDPALGAAVPAGVPFTALGTPITEVAG